MAIFKSTLMQLNPAMLIPNHTTNGKNLGTNHCFALYESNHGSRFPILSRAYFFINKMNKKIASLHQHLDFELHGL